MSPAIAKGLVAMGGCLGITGIGAWQLIEHLKPKTILEKLEREGEAFYPFGDGEEEAGWKIIAQKYQGSQGGEKLNNVTISSQSPTDTEIRALKNECKRLSGLSLDGDRTREIQQVKKWCTAGNPTLPPSPVESH